MLLSGMGQPALLYLVPFTLITSAALAAYRREMRQFWTGSTYEVSASPRLRSACVLLPLPQTPPSSRLEPPKDLVS